MTVQCHSKIGGTEIVTATEIGIVVMIGQIEETEDRAGLEDAADAGEAEEVIGLVEVGIRSMHGHEHCVIQKQAVDTQSQTKNGLCCLIPDSMEKKPVSSHRRDIFSFASSLIMPHQPDHNNSGRMSSHEYSVSKATMNRRFRWSIDKDQSRRRLGSNLTGGGGEHHPRSIIS